MNAPEGGRLLFAEPCYEARRGQRGAALWWGLTAVVAGICGWLLLTEHTPQGIPPSQLHSLTRSVMRTPDTLARVGTSHAKEVSKMQLGQDIQPLPLPKDAELQGASPSLVSGSLSAIGSGMVAVVALVAVVAQYLTRRTSPQIAMAPFLGMVQQVDKGADPNAGSSDRATEQHRIDQRVVFTSERWRKHRSGSRFTRALGTMPQSYVINHLVNPVIALSLSTAALCAAQLYFGTDVFSLPTSLFSLSAPSLGLLLVFRTNASYERWDGARKMIGLVKNRSEDLTRQMCVRFPANQPELKEQFLRYLQSFFFALKVHLRGGPGGFEDDNNLIEDLTPILRPNELQLLLQAQNRPGHIMCCMTQIAKEAGLEGAALFCFDQNLTTFEDVLGGCERILRTPIPLSYTRMTTRFLFVWLLLLPLALSGEILKLDHDIWLTIPAVAFIAFALLGIEEVGVQIEEPFTILPMETYAEGSRKNTSGIYAQMNEVAQITNK